jgi:hypothetical protein
MGFSVDAVEIHALIEYGIYIQHKEYRCEAYDHKDYGEHIRLCDSYDFIVCSC